MRTASPSNNFDVVKIVFARWVCQGIISFFCFWAFLAQWRGITKEKQSTGASVNFLLDIFVVICDNVTEHDFFIFPERGVCYG